MKKAYVAPTFLAEEVIPCKDIMCSTPTPGGDEKCNWAWICRNYPRGCKCRNYNSTNFFNYEEIDSLTEEEFLEEDVY